MEQIDGIANWVPLEDPRRPWVRTGRSGGQGRWLVHGELHREVGSHLSEFDHRNSGSLELEDEVEFPFGGFRVVNQSDPIEVGVADLHGAREIGRAETAKTQDDPWWLVGDLESSGTPVWESSVAGDPKKGRTIVSEVRHEIDHAVRGFRVGLGSRG